MIHFLFVYKLKEDLRPSDGNIKAGFCSLHGNGLEMVKEGVFLKKRKMKRQTDRAKKMEMKNPQEKSAGLK